MRLICLILLAFWQIPANAEILFSSEPSGKSEIYNFQTINSTNMIIVGGLGGTLPAPSAACTLDNSSTCNNCTAAFDVCNKKRIYDGLNLTFVFMSTSAPATPPTVVTPLITYDTGAGTQVLAHNASPTTTNGTNQPVTLTVRWDDICDIISGTAAGCAGAVSGQITVNLGISENDSTDLSDNEDDSISFTIKIVVPDSAFSTANTTGSCGSNGGLCSFSLYQGDEKATLRDLSLISSGLGTNYKYLEFYCSDVDYASIGRDQECTPRVAISGTNALQNDTITGLTNGITYYFRAGVVDEAGNVGLYTDMDLPQYRVTPEEVIGLFNENSCFIATAAYGSPMEKNVTVLKSFRDRVLLKSITGQLFVKAYYTLSPPLAKWIAQSPSRRSFARTLLAPMVWLAAFVMESPWLFCLFILLTFGGFLFWLRQRREQLA